MVTYKLNIGDRLKNDKRDLTITNRKIVKKNYVSKDGKPFIQNQVLIILSLQIQRDIKKRYRK